MFWPHHGSTDFKIFFTRSEKALSVWVGQSATWHNWLCILSAIQWSAIFVFSHFSHCGAVTVELDLDQRWTTLTLWVVWQRSHKLIAWCLFPLSCSLRLNCALFWLSGDEYIIQGVCCNWNLVCLPVCGCPFLYCHYCPWDLWVVCIFHHLLTFCGGNWRSMLEDEVVIQLGVVGGHLD